MACKRRHCQRAILQPFALDSLAEFAILPPPQILRGMREQAAWDAIEHRSDGVIPSRTYQTRLNGNCHRLCDRTTARTAHWFRYFAHGYTLVCLSAIGCSSQGGTVKLFPWQQGSTIAPPATGTAYPGGDLAPTLGPAATPFSPAPGTPYGYTPSTPSPYGSGLNAPSPYSAGGAPANGDFTPSYTSPQATSPPALSNNYNPNSGGMTSFLPPPGPPASAPSTYTPHWGGQFPSSGFSYPQASNPYPSANQAFGQSQPNNWWANLTSLGRRNDMANTTAWMGSGGRSGGDIFSRPLSNHNPGLDGNISQYGQWASANPATPGQPSINMANGNRFNASPNLSPAPFNTTPGSVGTPGYHAGLAQTSPYGGPGSLPSTASANGMPLDRSPYSGGGGGYAPTGGAASTIPLRKLDDLPPATPQQVQRDERVKQASYSPDDEQTVSKLRSALATRSGNPHAEPPAGDVTWRSPR